jgi:hypothetical protein
VCAPAQYYPPNINYSRCCEQPICTECFVQIKRAEPTPQHLESEPAACPYCVQEDFGVVYTPPKWRTGIGSEGGVSALWSCRPGTCLSPVIAFTDASFSRHADLADQPSTEAEKKELWRQ